LFEALGVVSAARTVLHMSYLRNQREWLQNYDLSQWFLAWVWPMGSVGQSQRFDWGSDAWL